MKICPGCRGEYLDHIEFCHACEQRLVGEHEISTAAQGSLMSKEELLQHETIAFSEGTLDSCRDLEKTLTKAQIPCAIYPLKLGNGNDATLGTTSMSQYMLLVRLVDVERCQEALLGRFDDHVAREGKGRFVRDAVDVSASEVTCPACSERVSLQNDECPSCGLFLGQPKAP